MHPILLLLCRFPQDQGEYFDQIITLITSDYMKIKMYYVLNTFSDKEIKSEIWKKMY